MIEDQQMIKDCEEREERLTDWERGFIDSLSMQLSKGRSLSVRQSERLETIWEKATAKG